MLNANGIAWRGLSACYCNLASEFSLKWLWEQAHKVEKIYWNKTKVENIKFLLIYQNRKNLLAENAESSDEMKE